MVAVIVGGSTWFAIKLQLYAADPVLSVAYRFGIAAVILLTYCLWRGISLRFSLKHHTNIALQGVFLFSINYLLFYMSEEWLTSGLVAVVFSSVLFMNIINEAWLLGTFPGPIVVIGGLVGMVGIGTVFWPEIIGLQGTRNTFIGLILAVLGTFSTSLGMITSARNQARGLPVIQTNALGMLYGAVLMVALALVIGRSFRVYPSASYIGSLLYLALFGSVIGFGAFLTLLGRIGPGRAAYAALLVPVIALLISWVFEGYEWNWFTALGIFLIVSGNVIALRPRREAVV